MKFKKYVSAGNDFLILRKEDLNVEVGTFVRSICNRKFGVGADGVLLYSPSEKADIKMGYFNSDGSEGEMCGNGIMSFAKYIYEMDIVKKDVIDIETKAGVMKAELVLEENIVIGVKINLNKPIFEGGKIPIKIEKDEILEEIIEIDNKEYVFSAVNMGVPHVVIFVDEIKSYQVDYLGQKIEEHELFPAKTNVNFVKVKSRREINIWTWERGAGRTLGCGTGSSASVVLGNKLGELDDSVYVHTEGGELKVELLNEEVYLTGAPEIIAKGKYYY